MPPLPPPAGPSGPSGRSQAQQTGTDVTAQDLWAIVRVLPDVIFRCEKDAKGRIIWTLNEGRLAEEFHLTTAQVRGKTLDEMFPPPVAERMRPHFEAAFRGEPAEFVNEMNGRHFKHFPQPMRDASGKVVAVVGFISEVTSLVQAESLIRQLNESLLQRVVELNETNQRLASANRELDRANQDLEAFSYTVSHDLRTPLTVLQNLLYVLEVKNGPTLDVTARDQLQRMRKATRRMETLIADILQFSRAGRGDVKRERVDVSQIATETASLLDARSPDQRTQWVIPPGVAVHADGRLVRIVVENLLGNAWKYSAKVEHPRVELRVERRADGPLLSVVDNGIGFDPAQAGRMFQPFQRLPGSETYEGSGIGLATVARAVERHGGRVWADSTPGQGASFHFTFGPSTLPPGSESAPARSPA